MPSPGEEILAQPGPRASADAAFSAQPLTADSPHDHAREEREIALERAQGEFEAAVQDYEAGEGAMWLVNRKWAAVEALSQSIGG